MALLTTTNAKVQEKEIKKTDNLSNVLSGVLEKDIFTFFKKIAREFQVQYSETGSFLGFDQFSRELKSILQNSNKRTAGIFSRNIRGDLKYLPIYEYKQDELDNNVEVIRDVNTRIALQLGNISDEQATNSTRQVLRTSNILINTAIVNSVDKLGIEATVSQIAKEASDKFIELSEARSELIGTQEVGIMVSESKQTEAEVLNTSPAVIGGVAVAGKIKKNWNALLDKSTRIAHAQSEARYLTRPINIIDKFIVGQDLLRFPRDPNGTPSNVINCRCQSLIMLR